MNIKDLIFIFGLALLSSWAIQYFFMGKRTQEPKDEVSFVAASATQVARPLNAEIDFVDTKRPAKVVTTPVETTWGSLVFSTDGATLESLAFKREVNGKDKQLPTIFSPTDTQREKRAFLVALNEKTPYYYSLTNKQSDADTVKLTYTGSNDQVTIQKTFVIFKAKHQVDLNIQVKAKGEEKINEVRLFYPAPLMPELGADEAISGLVIQRDGVFEKIPFKSISTQKGWYEPQVFGGDDRYFVHAVVTDPSHFIDRAYFNVTGHDHLSAILESKPSDMQGAWNLSFYLGPKEAQAIDAVDVRLEQALDYYGWLAPISKFLLTILKWLYRYLHNYGLAIIVLTVAIRAVLFPFTLRSERSMRDQREVQKKLAYLEKKYKDDPERLALERAEFMKKHGLPGLGGCLPLLVQIPIFFALSRVLANSIELYQAPWLWISNLAARDPYYILPLLVFITLMVQAMSGGRGGKTKGNEYIFGIATALMFGALTASLSAGLALYIFISTLLQVMQSLGMQYWGKRTAA